MNAVEIAALDALDLLVVVDNESDTRQAQERDGSFLKKILQPYSAAFVASASTTAMFCRSSVGTPCRCFR
jgi:hypothetical protein